MDLFRFATGYSDFRMREGQIVDGLNSVLWVERYREPGEIEVKGRLSSDIRNKLPVGCYVSHTNSDDIMIIESHEITDGSVDDPEVVVRGRSFETFLQHRIVGSNRAWPSSGALHFGEYSLPPGLSWVQAEQMLRAHLTEPSVINPADELTNFEIIRTATGSGIGEIIDRRVVSRGDLHTRLLEILAVSDVGVRVIRPKPTSPAVNKLNSVLLLYRGVDRSKSVDFSHRDSEVLSSKYFWTNLKWKNACLVTGRWVETIVNLNSATGSDRRIMQIDATDIDNDQPAAPTGEAYSLIVAAMRIRGREALSKQKHIALSDVDVAINLNTPRFRTHYGLGDTITVHGQYGQFLKQRVIEHVEIDDQEGSRAYPVITDLEEE